MTKKEIVLGVVALLATLIVGLVIGSHLKSSPSTAFGSIQTAPSHLTGSISNQDDTYFFGDQGVEIRNNAFFDGTTTFSGAVSGIFATSTLTSATITNLTATNVTTTNLFVSSVTRDASDVLFGTSTVGVVLRDATGVCHRIGVAVGSTLSAPTTTCP